MGKLSTSSKIRRYLKRYPDADAKDLAKRYKCTTTLVSQLRSSMNGTIPKTKSLTSKPKTININGVRFNAKQLQVMASLIDN